MVYPPAFDPEETLNSAFDLTHGEPVTVKILFSKSEARYIKEKSWSPIQHIIDNPDGSINLTMTSSGYRGLKRWVMSFGKEARLLEPEDMKKDIQVELEKSLEAIKEYPFCEDFTKELDIDRDPKALFIQENILKRL